MLGVPENPNSQYQLKFFNSVPTAWESPVFRDRSCSYNTPLSLLKPEHSCLKFKPTYYIYSFKHFSSIITNWKLSASLLPDWKQPLQQPRVWSVPCCLLSSTAGPCSGWQRLGKCHRASDTGMLLSPTDTRILPVYQSDKKGERVGLLGIMAVWI